MGWIPDEDDEDKTWMPPEMRWSVLIEADLQNLPAGVRESIHSRAKNEFGCVAGWRKDRRSEKGLRIPYRLAVRGHNAQECMQWIIETLCSQHSETVDLEDIWSLPTPDASHSTNVQHTLEQVIQTFADPAEDEVASLDKEGSALGSASRVQKIIQHMRTQAGLAANHAEQLQFRHESKLELDAIIDAWIRGLATLAIEHHNKLHGEYQDMLKDHCGKPMPDWLMEDQHIPEDLQSSVAHQLCSESHVCLCVQTFKRDFQLRRVLAINVAQTWAWRHRVTWCIFDPNEETDLMRWALDVFAVAFMSGHIIWLRAVKLWTEYHCCYAKNTAHMEGFQASLMDRSLRVKEAGLTADADELADRTLLMNWDNDNMMTIRWLHDCLRAADSMCSAENFALMESREALVGIQWQNANVGTTGRIAIPYRVFCRLGGYDESMLAIGVQDNDLIRRAALLGRTERRNATTSWTISNIEERVDRTSASSAKVHRNQKLDENAEKLKWFPAHEKSFGTYRKICKHNAKSMDRSLKAKRFKVNPGQEFIGVETQRVVEGLRLTVDLDEVQWPDGSVF